MNDPCLKVMHELQEIAAGGRDDRHPVVRAYTGNRQEAEAVARVLSHIRGKGDPIPLPSILLPPLG